MGVKQEMLRIQLSVSAKAGVDDRFMVALPMVIVDDLVMMVALAVG